MCSHNTTVQRDTHTTQQMPESRPTHVHTTQQCNRIHSLHSRQRSPDLHVFTQHNSATGYPPHTVDTGVQTYMCSHNTTVQQDTQPTQQTEESSLHVFTQQSNATGCSPHRVDPGVQTHDAAHNVRVFTCKVQQFVVYDMPTLTICPQSCNQNSTCILYMCVHSHVH